jgi:GxxExxY protein
MYVTTRVGTQLNHRGTETAKMTKTGTPEIKERDPLTSRVIGAAIEVHRHLGPGLLESAYEECLCWELGEAGLAARRQVPLPVVYKGVRLDLGYRFDVVVEDRLLLELKSVDKLLPIHEAQLLTYLRLSELKTGLLLNFIPRSCVMELSEWCFSEICAGSVTEAARRRSAV